MISLQSLDNNFTNIGIVNSESSVQTDVKINVEDHNSKPDIDTKIDITNQNEFIHKLSSTIKEVSNLQNIQSTINNQIDIVKEINLNIKNSSTPQQLDAVQPIIKNLMDNFNSNPIVTNLNQIMTDQESEKSTTYFDGILGSKPLNPSDIMKETDNKLRLLESVKSTTDDLFKKRTKEVKNIINQNKEESQVNSPFKDTNFTNFNINNISGSIVSSQANPSVSHIIKLLS